MVHWSANYLFILKTSEVPYVWPILIHFAGRKDISLLYLDDFFANATFSARCVGKTTAGKHLQKVLYMQVKLVSPF